MNENSSDELDSSGRLSFCTAVFQLNDIVRPYGLCIDQAEEKQLYSDVVKNAGDRYWMVENLVSIAVNLYCSSDSEDVPMRGLWLARASILGNEPIAITGFENQSSKSDGEFYHWIHIVQKEADRGSYDCAMYLLELNKSKVLKDKGLILHWDKQKAVKYLNDVRDRVEEAKFKTLRDFENVPCAPSESILPQ